MFPSIFCSERLVMRHLTVQSCWMSATWRPWKTTTGTASSSMMWTWSRKMIAIFTSATTSPNTWSLAGMLQDTSQFCWQVYQVESFFVTIWESSVQWHFSVDRLRYKGYFGGVTALTRDQFRQVNGFSNTYWGWGGEDDDLRIRWIQQNKEKLPCI